MNAKEKGLLNYENQRFKIIRKRGGGRKKEEKKKNQISHA